MSSDDIVKRLHFIARTDTDLLGCVAQKAADELQQLRAEVERQRATILLLGLADIERLAADNERLRAEVDRLRAGIDKLAEENYKRYWNIERLRVAGHALAEYLMMSWRSDAASDLVAAWREACREW